MGPGQARCCATFADSIAAEMARSCGRSATTAQTDVRPSFDFPEHKAANCTAHHTLERGTRKSRAAPTSVGHLTQRGAANHPDLIGAVRVEQNDEGEYAGPADSRVEAMAEMVALPQNCRDPRQIPARLATSSDPRAVERHGCAQAARPSTIRPCSRSRPLPHRQRQIIPPRRCLRPPSPDSNLHSLPDVTFLASSLGLSSRSRTGAVQKPELERGEKAISAAFPRPSAMSGVKGCEKQTSDAKAGKRKPPLAFPVP